MGRRGLGHRDQVGESVCPQLHERALFVGGHAKMPSGAVESRHHGAGAIRREQRMDRRHAVELGRHPHCAVVGCAAVTRLDRLGVHALTNHPGGHRELRRGQDEGLRAGVLVEALERVGVARGEGRRKSGCVDSVLLGEASVAEGGPQPRAALGQGARMRGACTDGLLGQVQAHRDLGNGGAFGQVDAVATHGARCTTARISPGTIDRGIGTDPGRRVERGIVEDRQDQAVFIGGRSLSVAHDALEMSEPRVEVGGPSDGVRQRVRIIIRMPQPGVERILFARAFTVETPVGGGW
ncbi:hypothetical protein SAMN05216418_3015 [Microbacterium enclense]|uniref:Uncharacterized protein n=1 Tax=Microbacterium enclense TaxID=993073 RepID=A0A1G6PJ58_9MICO|nr:hypothetical protein AS029_13665 [Microbacterium enclense]SDC80282.1 hypothetical protein SAMN05216418_3015 [Microbacterium enclense]